MTSETLKPTFHPYQLQFGRCSTWLQDAKKIWIRHPIFFALLAALVFGLRRVLDSMAMDIFIVLSYLTDAWIFAWVALGFAKGHEGGSASIEGLRFGVTLALLMAFYIAATHYGTMRIGKKMALTYLTGQFGEFVLVGLVIGLVYGPAGRASRRGAGV